MGGSTIERGALASSHRALLKGHQMLYAELPGLWRLEMRDGDTFVV